MTGNGKQPGTQLALVDRFAARVGVEPAVFKRTIKATVLKSKDRQATDEEMVAFLAIADKYGLDPWTKEIHAFVDKGGGIVPIVGVDGWNHIANDHKAFDGEELLIPPREEWVTIDKDAKPCPPWMEVTIHRSDRKHPTIHREYLDECYVPARSGQGKSGPYTIRGHWQTHTKRALEHKTRIQGRRIAFGFSGIYDEDEAARIIESQEARQGFDAEAEAVPCITQEQYGALVKRASLKGLTSSQLEKQLSAKGVIDGPLDDMPLSVFEAVMDGLTKMPDKDPEPPTDEPTQEPEPEVIDADEGDFWPSDDGEGAAVSQSATADEPAPEDAEDADLPGMGPDDIGAWQPEGAQATAAASKATQRQQAKIALLLKESGQEPTAVQAWMRQQWGISSRSQLSKDQAGKLIEHLSSAPGVQGALDEGVA